MPYLIIPLHPVTIPVARSYVNQINTLTSGGSMWPSSPRVSLLPRLRIVQQWGVLCRHFGICGGCSIQHLSYAEQLASKEVALLGRLPRTLREAGGPVASPLFVPTDAEAGAPRCFRQKVAFVFGSGPGGRGLVMGHYERGSNRIVPEQRAGPSRQLTGACRDLAACTPQHG